MSTLNSSGKVYCILKDISWQKAKYAKAFLLVLHNILPKIKYFTIDLFWWSTILEKGYIKKENTS